MYQTEEIIKKAFEVLTTQPGEYKFTLFVYLPAILAPDTRSPPTLSPSLPFPLRVLPVTFSSSNHRGDSFLGTWGSGRALPLLFSP